MTTPNDPVPESEEESSEFNLADYEIEESEEKEHSSEEALKTRTEKTEESSVEDVRALLKASVKDIENKEEAANPLSEKPLEKISPEELALTLIVEAGSIQLPYDRLLNLKAGTVLDIGLSPEQGVNLIVNGQCIGKGELVKIGETVGVRILQI